MHTRKNDVNGLSAIYINAVRNFITKIQRGRHQVVQTIKSCKKFSPLRLKRRRNGFEDYSWRTGHIEAIGVGVINWLGRRRGPQLR
jgi:hypothetical protein